jgi:hypothetical protein
MHTEAIVFIGTMSVLLALLALAFWLVFLTPLVRWALYGCLYGGLAYLTVQVLLLPFQHAEFRASGGTSVRVLPEDLLSKVDVAFNTAIRPGEGTDQFALDVTGSITNHSDRPIESIRIWCRVEKMILGDSEVVGNWIDVNVRPGEGENFTGRISGHLTGVTRAGHRTMQPPGQRFCRVDEIRGAEAV